MFANCFICISYFHNIYRKKVLNIMILQHAQTKTTTLLLGRHGGQNYKQLQNCLWNRYRRGYLQRRIAGKSSPESQCQKQATT